MQRYLLPVIPKKYLFRTELVKEMDIALQGKSSVIFLKAPAGYGKTYLLIDYAHHIKQQGNRVVWASLDNDNNSPEFFFNYFLNALKTQNLIDENIIFDENISLVTFIYQLIDELQQSKQSVYLFFDDFQHITHPVIVDFFQQLILNSAENIFVILASRNDLPFPSAKAFIGQKIFKIKAHQLAFSHDEIKHISEQSSQKSLSLEQVNIIFNKTGGWPAVIGLEGSLSNIEFDLTEKENLAEYFYEEVIGNLSEQEQLHLISISVSDFLCEPLVEELTEQSDFLQQTVMNLPVYRLDAQSLSEKYQWYVLQPLFKEYLRKQLKLNDKLDEEKLNKIVGDWYVSQDIHLEAVEHYIKADKFEQAVSILEENGVAIMASGDFPHFKNLISKLPYDVLVSNVSLLVLQDWYYTLTYQYDSARSNVQLIESMVAENLDIEDELNIQLLGLKAANAAWSDTLYLYQDKVDQMMEQRPLVLPFMENALRCVQSMGLLHRNEFERLDLLADAALFFAHGGSFFYSTINIRISVAMKSFVLGEFSLCKLQSEDIEKFISEHHANSPLIHIAKVLQGMLAYVQGDLATAELHFVNSGEAINYLAEPSFLAWYQACHIQLLTDLNQNDKRELLIEKTLELMASRKLSFSKIPSYFEAINYYISINDRDEALELYHKIKNENIDATTPENNHLIFNEQLLDCLVFSSQGSYEKSIPTLIELAEQYAQVGRVLQQSKCLVMLVNNYILKQDNINAKQVLKKLIAVASKKHLLQYFARLDNNAIGFIHEWSLTELSPLRKAFMIDICQRFEGTDVKQRFNIVQVERLTSAEQKVMEMLGTGYSNQQIGDHLCVSINTVKTHLKNSYAKLGVSNRIQAIQVFGQLQHSQNNSA